MYDLGDTIPLAVEIRDADGLLADATTVTCTVTLPDHTSASVAVAHPATGRYAAPYTPSVAGRFIVRWVATGNNACAFTDTFTVVSAVPLLSAERVAAKGHVAVPVYPSTQRAALDTAIEDATGLVLGHLRRDSVDSLRPAAQDAIRAVATRVALRLWRNPSDVASESYEGMSQTWTDPRILTGDERTELAPWRARARGPIRQILRERPPS